MNASLRHSSYCIQWPCSPCYTSIADSSCFGKCSPEVDPRNTASSLPNIQRLGFFVCPMPSSNRRYVQFSRKRVGIVHRRWKCTYAGILNHSHLPQSSEPIEVSSHCQTWIHASNFFILDPPPTTSAILKAFCSATCDLSPH